MGRWRFHGFAIEITDYRRGGFDISELRGRRRDITLREEKYAGERGGGGGGKHGVHELRLG